MKKSFNFLVTFLLIVISELNGAQALRRGVILGGAALTAATTIHSIRKYHGLLKQKKLEFEFDYQANKNNDLGLPRLTKMIRASFEKEGFSVAFMSSDEIFPIGIKRLDGKECIFYTSSQLLPSSDFFKIFEEKARLIGDDETVFAQYQLFIKSLILHEIAHAKTQDTLTRLKFDKACFPLIALGTYTGFVLPVLKIKKIALKIPLSLIGGIIGLTTSTIAVVLFRSILHQYHERRADAAVFQTKDKVLIKSYKEAFQIMNKVFPPKNDLFELFTTHPSNQKRIDACDRVLAALEAGADQAK